MAKDNKKVKKGFTIIEVVLVLAIAGLIFLMVFVALPALQRSQRDTQRRDDLARVATALTQYQTNNGGKLPDAASCAATAAAAIKPNDATTYTNKTCKFIAQYLNASNSATNEFVDPDGTAYAMNVVHPTAASGITAVPATVNHIIYIYTHSHCDGETVKYDTKDNDRDYALTYKLEGAGVYCADNK